MPVASTDGAWGPRAWLYGPAVLWLVAAAGGVAYTAADASKWEARDQRDAAVVTSSQCRRCHEPQYGTWHASYHRTMTQTADQDAVLAPFGGESLETLGFRATMFGRDDGKPRIRIERVDGGEVIVDAAVELTVGSHRYQQYVARIDRGGGPLERWRLPVAWHIGEQRWIHLGAAFLLPDGVSGSEDDYLRHLSRWNDNCLFCHNTEPSPGLRDGRYETEIGELGIACEACHGPAGDHVERMEQPVRRVLSVLSDDGGDEAIVSADHLDPSRSAQVCGRCHGNRIGRNMAEILAHGDGFVPGAELASVSRPIFRDARLAHQPEGEHPFAARFWPDGTPRLSAYEYQALLLSPCHDEGRGMTCGTCHTMHGEEPSMQLRPDYSPQATCGSCHPQRELSDGVKHGGHSDEVDCADCHLPRVTYGLLEGMMSHRITIPDPEALGGRDDQPDACTQCHVDRSRAWAAEHRAGPFSGETTTADGTTPSRVELDLVGGDPIQRALAAHALARPDAVGDSLRRRRALADALEDEYPAVRWFAWRGLRAMSADGTLDSQLEAFDASADASERVPVSAAVRDQLGPSVLARDPERMSTLQRQRDDRAIEIGE